MTLDFQKIGRGVLGVLIVLITAWGIHKAFTASVDLTQLRGELRSFSFLEVAGLLAISTAMMILRAFRFHLLLQDSGQVLTLWQTTRIFIMGQVFAPLPGGESSRPILLKKQADVAIKESVTPMIVLGITEMIVAGLIALIGSLFLDALRVAALVAFVGSIGLVWILVNHKLVSKILRHMPSHPKLHKAGKAVVATQKDVKEVIFERRSFWPSRLFLINLFFAFLTCLLGGFLIKMLASHFSLPLGILFCLYIFAAATVLAEMIPIAPGGIGPTEGGMTGILVISGVVLPQALVIVLLYRASTLLYGVVLGLVFLLLYYLGSIWPRLRKYLQNLTQKQKRALAKQGVWLVGVAAGSLVLGWAVQNISLISKFDTWLYKLAYYGPHPPILATLNEPFNYNLLFHVPFLPQDMPTFFYFMITGVAIYLWFKRRADLPWFLGSVLAGNLLVHFITLLDTNMVFRERPFLRLDLPIDPRGYEAWRYLSAFPSGHVRDTSLYASLIAFYIPRLKWPAIILIAFIAFMRVHLGAHYPLDVVAGAGIGLGVAFIVRNTTQILQARR